MTKTMLELPIAPLEAIPPGEGRSFSAMGYQIAIFRSRDGQVFATQAACPHRGGPLADGLVGGTTLICPLHGWKFDLATGAPLMGECGLKTFPARLDDQGRIVIRFGDGNEK